MENDLLAKQEQRLASQNRLDDEIQPAYDTSQIALEETRASLDTLHEKSTDAEKQRDLIKSELELDARQKEIQDQQRDRQQKLQDLPQVETDYQLWTELNRVIPELDKIVSDLLASEQGIGTVTASLQSLTAELDALVDRRAILDQLKEQSENLGANLETAKKREEKIRSELNTNETLLEKREEAHGESICPTCGTSLEGELLDQFHQELNRLQKAVSAEQSALKEARQHTQDLEEETAAINKQVRQEETAITQDESRLATEQKNLQSDKIRFERQKQAAQNQWGELKDSLSYSAHIVTGPTQECLELARKRLNAMSNVQKTRDSLMKTQAAFESAQAELDRIQAQRQHEPGTFSQSQLDEAVRAIAELDSEIKQTKPMLKAKQDEERRLFKLVTETKSELNSLSERIQNLEQELLPQERELLDESERNQRDTSQRFDSHITTLGWAVQNLQTISRAANNDQQAEQEIRAWVDEYRPLAKQISELRNAESEIDDLRSRYAVLDEQIQSYPDDVREGQSETIKRNLQTKRTEKITKDAELQEWREKAWRERESLSRKQTLQKEHERLITEEKDFRDLADLLAPPGTRSSSVGGPLLQAIMRDALKNVADRASNILEEWDQATQILLSKDSLEFKVIDLESGSSERHYQLFSGGEKFMVALAMALAIGEVASDTGHTDCLFIDEGFGLLDRDNRAYVAQEIVNKLVSSGRRKQVIVITHMEDIQDAFADGHSRYHLIKDGTTTRLFEEDSYASS